MPRLCYCIQIRFLPVQSEIEMLILAFCWFKQAVALVSFPTWVSTRCSGNLCLVSQLRDVTGEPRWNHGVDAGSALR